MKFLEYIKDKVQDLPECDCGAEYMHPRTCARVIAWDKLFEAWRHSGLTLEEGMMAHPDFERLAREMLGM